MIFFGIFLGILITELSFRIFIGSPPILTKDKHFYEAYIDIHNSIFKKDNENNIYISQNQQNQLPNLSFKKSKNEKRIFIVGESVAQQFNSNIIYKKFKKLLPQYEWKVLNCGMGGYDSYRVMLVTKEIINYEPDLIILMMGNNEGSHNPIKINHWIYKYNFLAKIWIGRIISDFLNPPVQISHKSINEYFKANLQKIINMVQKRKTHLVICTLPYNTMLPQTGNPYHDREFFTGWWLLNINPQKAKKIFLQFNNNSYYWYLAKAYELSNEKEIAKRIYRMNRNFDQNKRNNIIRNLDSANKYFTLLDFDRNLINIFDGNPGFDAFFDNVHYWPSVYSFLANNIAEKIYHNNLKNSYNTLDNVLNWKNDQFENIDKNFILKQNDELFQKKDQYVLFYRQVTNKISIWPFFEEIKNNLHFFYYKNPNLIINFKEVAKQKYIIKDLNKRLCLMGEVLRENAKYRLALEYFNEVLNNDKNLYIGYLFRGLCYYNIGNKKMAQNDFIRLRDMNHDFKWLTIDYLDTLK